MSIGKTLLETLRALAGSKKFVTAIIAGLVWAGGKIGLDLSSEVVGGIVTPLLVAILGQGVADVGKSKALAESSKTP